MSSVIIPPALVELRAIQHALEAAATSLTTEPEQAHAILLNVSTRVAAMAAALKGPQMRDYTPTLIPPKRMK